MSGVKIEHKRFELVIPAAEIVEKLRPFSVKCKICGSFRRKKEVIGDLDITVLCKDEDQARACIARFCKGSKKVVRAGNIKATVLMTNPSIGDYAADLFTTINPESWGALVEFATGSKRHNIQMRARAKRKGFTLNEKGLWRGKKRIAGDTEESIYEALGTPYQIPANR